MGVVDGSGMIPSVAGIYKYWIEVISDVVQNSGKSPQKLTQKTEIGLLLPPKQ